MIHSWNNVTSQTYSFARNENRNSRDIRFGKSRESRELLYSVWVKIRIYNRGLLGIPLGSIFYHERGTRKKKKKERTDVTLYLFFQITVVPYDRIVQQAEMHTHTGFSDPLSSRSIVKPRIVRYIGCAPSSISATSGCLKEDREWEKKRYLLPATKFSCFQRIFLFRLYNLILPQSRMFPGDYLSECVFSTGK